MTLRWTLPLVLLSWAEALLLARLDLSPAGAGLFPVLAVLLPARQAKLPRHRLPALLAGLSEGVWARGGLLLPIIVLLFAGETVQRGRRLVRLEQPWALALFAAGVYATRCGLTVVFAALGASGAMLPLEQVAAGVGACAVLYPACERIGRTWWPLRRELQRAG